VFFRAGWDHRKYTNRGGVVKNQSGESVTGGELVPCRGCLCLKNGSTNFTDYLSVSKGDRKLSGGEMKFPGKELQQNNVPQELSGGGGPPNQRFLHSLCKSGGGYDAQAD